MPRYVPAALAFQNERQRSGYWVAVTQQLDPGDSLSFGWAHANRAEGDPGQHNAAPWTWGMADSPGAATRTTRRGSLWTAALKHSLGQGVVAYAAWAVTANEPYAQSTWARGGVR